MYFGRAGKGGTINQRCRALELVDWELKIDEKMPKILFV